MALSRLRPCRNVKNDLSGTIHSAGYKFCKAAALQPESKRSPTIHAAKFPINKKNLFISKSWQIACPWRLQLVSSTDVLIYVDVISNKQSIFSSQIRTPSFSINWPSLVSTARSPIILWRLWSHKPSHKHDSNKYQSKAFVICDHKSDETRSVTHVNKAYLVWLMFRVLSNQHYHDRTNQKLPSWANAAFQNRGVGGQAFPSFPSPFPVIPFFFFCSQLSRRTDVIQLTLTLKMTTAQVVETSVVV